VEEDTATDVIQRHRRIGADPGSPDRRRLLDTANGPVRRPAGASIMAVVLTACMPVVAPIDFGVDGAPEGPQLAVEVANTSDREITIGYDFEEFQSSGGGVGTVAPCEQVAIPFGLIGGRYTVLLDGEALLERAVPAGAPADTWVVVRVRIDPDGGGEVIGSRIAVRMPDPQPRPISDCG